MLKDVNAEKAHLTGIVESLETTLAERDGEIHALKTEASLGTGRSHSVLCEVIGLCDSAWANSAFHFSLHGKSNIS